MMRDRATPRPERGTYVFVVCGPNEHVRTLNRSLAQLRTRTRRPVLVVTDLERNHVAIEHDRVIDVKTPANLTDHQASIFLKTALHRWVPEGELYCYLDSDIYAVRDDVDGIFDRYVAPITFASDLPTSTQTVARFSPWAVNCACDRKTTYACMHLTEAIERRFDLRVPSDWSLWNGGVFLFDAGSRSFLDSWHATTLEIFGWPEWRVRDQGSLIVTVWRLGLAEHPRLPLEYNFLVDFDNPGLSFDRELGYALDDVGPYVRARFLHLYHCPLETEEFSFGRDVEKRLEDATRDRRRHGHLAPSAPPGLVPRLAGLLTKRHQAPYRVVVSTDDWVRGPVSQHGEALVRGLLAAGHDARILLTESRSPLIAPRERLEPFPPDLPVDYLTASSTVSWASQWGTLIRYLEDSKGPRLYLPLEDIRNSVVCTKLSDRIRVVPTLFHDSESTYHQAARLGGCWNAVVAVSPRIAETLVSRNPGLAGRCVWIPLSLHIPPRPRVVEGAFSFEILCVPPLPAGLEEWIVGVRRAGISASWVVTELEGEAPGALEGSISSERPQVRSHESHPALLETLRRASFLLVEATRLSHPAVRQAGAMGCLPLVWGTGPDRGGLLDAVTGFRLTEPLASSLVEKLGYLRTRPDRHAEMLRHAHRRAQEVEVSEARMAGLYAGLFEEVEHEVQSGRYRRPRVGFETPPRRIGTDIVFGVEEGDVCIPGEGTFLRPHFGQPWGEYLEFRNAVHEGLRSKLPEIAPDADPDRPESWLLNTASRRLVRGLRRSGHRLLSRLVGRPTA